ncbi:AAA family ATPase [Pyxidicoccus fallax]|uniref:histidine kinase n=1 Tax=Pyxidicoccus fallax TaxID=394095 RepID=A0A848L5A8_9BACT|nr:AAA family ATPase [Pyxidicoccus fallax]NMO13806.1 AAA family ATPase [Pyxidicoccus fallax]NPC77007.1 AAA family ATPase [Pyxidicoccus fallax]
MLQAQGDEGLREIHRGRRYVVLRGWKQGGEPRVVKRVLPGPLASGSGAMLRHEYTLLRSLQGEVPGVSRALALEEDAAGLPSLVLEDAGPRNLQEWLGRRPVSMDAFLELALQLTGIIASLHQQHVIHRDINPTNLVMGDGSRHVTLVDFDLATRVAGLSPGASMPNELQWTLPYVAPEQTGRMSRPVDHRADLYSLGATFYELLTGLPPFVSTDPAELVHAHLARPPVPPAFANPAVPRPLSDIVLKLLAKMPEERYQSAEALLADLLEVRRRQTAGVIGAFELGRVDLARQLPFPKRPHGRERELARLREALERVRRGPSEGVLLVGEPGIGKSALVRELARRAGPGDHVLRGKFNQLQGNVPYAAFADAFQGLLRQLRNEPPEVRDLWRDRLRQAVGPDARVIAELLPQLGALLGPRPMPTRVAPMEAAARLHLAFQSFVRTLATPESVLVLFLDDLQWADPGSLQLLKALATDPGSRHVLVVGAYQPARVGPDHPLTRLLAQLRAREAMSFPTLTLGPLDLPSVTAFCAETFRCEPAHARPLAAVVLRKTAGNPLFITRFLRLLHESGLLTFDLEHGTWEWDVARVEQVDVTENVVALMMTTIRRLPEQAQRVLEVAACLGDHVELWLLRALVEDAGPALWSLLREGLLVPEREGGPPPPEDGDAEDAPLEPEAVYRFAHDRVRQAAYDLLTEDERRRLHHEIGRELLRGATGDTLDARLFAVVDHLHLGLARPGGEVEGWDVAELHYQAGLKAKAASAFGAALVYLRRGIALIPRAQWASRREQVFHLHKEAAECAYFSGEPVLAGELVRTALESAGSRLEQVELHDVQVLTRLMMGDFKGAIQDGREGLRLLGMELPERDFDAALAAELAQVEVHMRGRSVEELLDAPRMEDPELLVCVRLLSDLTVPAYLLNSGLFAVINTRALNLTLEHGHSDEAPAIYSCHGMVLSSLDGPTSGLAFGRLGVALAQRNGDLRQECRALLSLAVYFHTWKAPLRTSLPLLRRSYATGIAAGDVQFAAYAITLAVAAEFSMGAELARVQSSVEACQTYLRRSGVPGMDDLPTAHAQAVLALQGRTRRPPHFDDDSFDEQSFMDMPLTSMNRHLYATLRQLVAYLLGDLDEALRMSEAARPHAASVRNFYRAAEHAFLTALTLAAHATAHPEARAGDLARIEEHQRKLEAWARDCPENFRHKHQLVTAEVARVEGRPLEAMELYDEAIDGARAEGFLQEEAMANELAGRFHHALGHGRFATLHLRAALEAYARWGAWAKVSLLEEEFPDLKLAGGRAWSEPARTVAAEGAAPGAALDLHGLLKASETLVGEVVLDRLMEKLMAVCLEVAGATSGALVLEEGGALVVRARGAVSEPVSLEPVPLDAASTVPATVVQHAWTTGATLVLGDAAHQGRFIGDPYIARRAVKSALAVPIQRQARTVGVLYLENDLATRAFTPERVSVLRALSSQMAISLENSRLFEQLKVEVQERRRAEAAVRFLAESGLALAESLDLEQTLAKALHMVVPFLADWCVFAVAENGDSLRVMATAHVDPEKEARLGGLMRKHPLEWSAPPVVLEALTSGQPVLRAHLDADRLAEAGNGPEYVEEMQALGTRTAMHVPLIARGKTLGVLTLASGAPGRRYGEADLDLAQELARRAAICIDNARLYRAAQEAIRLRDDFLSVASHELNTPLTSLRLMVHSLLRHRPAGLPEPAVRALHTIDAQSLKLATLIEELLDVSRLHADRLDLRLEEVDLRAVIDRVTDRLREPLEKAGCALDVRVESPILGRWDATRLGQVLHHLLSNALKFGAGKPIHIAAGVESGTAWLRVSDEGIGIAPDKLPHIFERFGRAVSVRSYGGLGLGLHLVRAIVDALGGTIRAESTLGVGTTFTMELPCAGPPHASG